MMIRRSLAEVTVKLCHGVTKAGFTKRLELTRCGEVEEKLLVIQLFYSHPIKLRVSNMDKSDSTQNQLIYQDQNYEHENA